MHFKYSVETAVIQVLGAFELWHCQKKKNQLKKFYLDWYSHNLYWSPLWNISLKTIEKRFVITKTLDKYIQFCTNIYFFILAEQRLFFFFRILFLSKEMNSMIVLWHLFESICRILKSTKFCSKQVNILVFSVLPTSRQHCKTGSFFSISWFLSLFFF